MLLVNKDIKKIWDGWRMRLVDMSLQKKISLPIAAGLIIGLGLFSLLGLQAVRNTTDRILDERLNRARIVADLLDENLAHLQFHIQTAATLIADVNSEPEFDSAVDSLTGMLADSDIPILNIIQTDGNGKVLHTMSKDPEAGSIDFSRYPDLARITDISRPHISNAVLDKSGNQVVLVVSPIVDRTGDITGTVAAVVDIDHSTIPAFGQAGRIGETGYTEVVDGNGTVLIRTQPSSPAVSGEKSDHPLKFAQLINEDKAAVRTCHRCHESSQNITRKRDLLAFAPLSTATWGVALRQSEEEALGPTKQLEQRLLLIGAIVLAGILLVIWIIMQSVVRPLGTLTAAAQRVASGDFTTTAPGRRRDEIGRLSAAFHTMTDKLDKSRSEILSRHHELSVLNSIATTVSQSLNLDLILKSALQRVLEVTHASSGCVFLADGDKDVLTLKVRVGRPDLFDCKNSSLCPGPACACYQALRNGRTTAVTNFNQCPLLVPGSDKSPGIFITIPLKSRARTLGVMNVCCPDPGKSTDDDFRLLESIGFYVGLAIENSMLYEEASEKEELRRQLLGKIITAQEEERKRLARELHDEHAQTLTGLIMNLEKMEDMILPQQTQLKAKLEKARTLLSRTLDNIRSLTVGLRPSDLDDLGLIAAISVYAEDRLEDAGIMLKFEADDFEGYLTPTMETALFRILQEAINNIIKHASAKKVTMELRYLPGEVVAVVVDNGRGFELNLKNKDAGLGLLGIRERTELLGGTFDISSRPEQGTCLTIRIPIAESVPSGVKKVSSDERG